MLNDYFNFVFTSLHDQKVKLRAALFLFFLCKSVLPCAILCPHHVHQLGAERKRLSHCIQWVSQSACKIIIMFYMNLLAEKTSLTPLPCFLQSGMTVEVLGTVFGTAIQGQIVGMANAPCLPGPLDIVANLSNSSNPMGLNNSEPVISLDHTVNKLI